jgi:hypothetical protein
VPHKPRFTLKAILGCVAALCVALGVAMSFWPDGLVVLPFVVGGSVGYLLRSWGGLIFGVILATPVLYVAVAVLLSLQWLG